MSNENLLHCNICGANLISEESDGHNCHEKVLDYKIENNILWISDGKKWYPSKRLKSPARILNQGQ